MMKKVIFFLVVFCVLDLKSLQPPVHPETAFRLPSHPITINNFLMAYGTWQFNDITEKEVFFPNFPNCFNRDISYALTYVQAKDILGKAYSDLSKFDVNVPNNGLKEDYREALLVVYNTLGRDHPSEGDRINKNRKQYRDAWFSGDAARIKDALKLELYIPMPD